MDIRVRIWRKLSQVERDLLEEDVDVDAVWSGHG